MDARGDLEKLAELAVRLTGRRVRSLAWLGTGERIGRAVKSEEFSALSRTDTWLVAWDGVDGLCLQPEISLDFSVS